MNPGMVTSLVNTTVTMVFMILVAVMTVLCIILNTIGIYAFFKLPRTPANLVYLHLCITDLIVGIFVTPYSIVLLKNDLQSYSAALCTMQGIMFEISYTTTLFILTYISVDRLIALYQPLKYKKVMSARVLFWINIATWIFPIVRPIARYTINYLLTVSKDSGEEAEYSYTNDEFFMVCYNTDYMKFIKSSDGGIAARLKLLDQCIIIVTCQVATLVSSILVVARLSHRLHIKRVARAPPLTSTMRRPSTQLPTADAVAVVERKTHHFHPSPDNNSTTMCNSLRDDEVTIDNTLGDDSSGDSGGHQHTKRIRSRKKKREAERHAIITMVTVIVFFMVTYTPSFICFIWPGLYNKDAKGEAWIFLLIDYCTFVNSTFLPMVHFSRSAGFKSQLKHLGGRAKTLFTGNNSRPGKSIIAARNKTMATELERNGNMGKAGDISTDQA